MPGAIAQLHRAAGNTTAAHVMPAHVMSPYLFASPTGYYVLFESALIRTPCDFVLALRLCALFALVATLLPALLREREARALPKPTALAAAAVALREALHYLVMLLAMTMNVWLIAAVCAGHALGWLAYAAVLRMRRRPLTPESVAAASCGCATETEPLLPRRPRIPPRPYGTAAPS